MALLAAIAEPRRQAILRLVWDRERSAGDIARQFDVSFAAISQHLAKLRAAGAVRRRRDGKQIFYQADRAALGPLAAALEAMWARQLDVLKSLAEAEQQRLSAPPTPKPPARKPGASRLAKPRSSKRRKSR